MISMVDPGLRYTAMKNGASECLVKKDILGEDLNKAIHMAVAAVRRPRPEVLYPAIHKSHLSECLK